MATIVIPHLFQAIAEKVNLVLCTRVNDPFFVYYDYGHYDEVTRRLTSKDGSISQKGKKFPLIWLVMDFDEDFGSLSSGYCELPDLQIFIAMQTKNTTSTSERYEKVFLPRLYPVYDELKNQIADSGFFDIADPEEIIHKKTDRPYWGVPDNHGNGTSNLFNDFIDAIQIWKLKLSVNEQACDKFNIIHF